MSIWESISNFFNSKKKKEDEWAKNFANQKPAKPNNLLPLDPGNSSMT